jgi:hypothetical protein
VRADAVKLDDHPLPAPVRVDREPRDLDVQARHGQAGLLAQLEQADLELAARPGELGLMGGERRAEGAAPAAPAPAQGARGGDVEPAVVVGLGEHPAQLAEGHGRGAVEQRLLDRGHP